VTLTKRQKTSIALFGIAVAALVIDRAFLGGGSAPADASASSSPASITPTPQASEIPEEEQPPPTIRLRQRLETLWLEKDMNIDRSRDVFSLPESWLNDVLPKKPEMIPPPKNDAVTVFITSHKLQAVVISDQTCCVTVNDQVLELDDELDGFKLVAIEEDSATFEYGTRRVILKLENDR